MDDYIPRVTMGVIISRHREAFAEVTNYILYKMFINI